MLSVAVLQERIMFLKISLYLVCTVFVFCESGFVDTLRKCEIDDSACAKDLFQSVIKQIAISGLPELGVPPLDPIVVTNMSMTVMDILDVTLIEGTGKGAKDCIINKFETNVEEERGKLELTCDFSLKGRYKVYSDNPLVKSFVGGDTLSGEGNGKVKMEKLNLKVYFGFFIYKRDGELYIKIKSDKINYSYDIKKMQFFADKLYIGKQESSKLVTGLLNDNWRTLMSSFGKPYTDKAKDYVLVFFNKFFDTVPAKNYISTDLSKYARDAA